MNIEETLPLLISIAIGVYLIGRIFSKKPAKYRIVKTDKLNLEMRNDDFFGGYTYVTLAIKDTEDEIIDLIKKIEAK